jgi:hypothetical protein
MGCKEVVERAGQIHPLRDGRQSSGQAACSSRQERKSFTKRLVQTLTVGLVEHLTARRAPQHGQEQSRAAVNEPMQRTRHHSTGILFDHLRNRQFRLPECVNTPETVRLGDQGASGAAAIGLCASPGPP